VTDDITTEARLFEVEEVDVVGLQPRFKHPPFSVLHAASGAWQKRKSAWLKLGIQSEVGRGENLLHMSDAARQGYEKKIGIYAPGAGGNLVQRKNGGWVGTSIFDPVLCELSYRWWCPPGGMVLDPFAGGSVRGIVATHHSMGLGYEGVELRPEQVASNREQAAELAPYLGPFAPVWYEGDTLVKMWNLAQEGPAYDMVFTCPPYGRLEIYSDLPTDLSAMGEEAFDDALAKAVDLSSQALLEDRFSVWVIGDERRKDGSYHGIPWRLIQAGLAAGLKLYNIAILVTATGSLAIRTGRLFQPQRKLGPMHQYVVVFLKGDPKRAGAACAWPGEDRDLQVDESEEEPDAGV